MQDTSAHPRPVPRAAPSPLQVVVLMTVTALLISSEQYVIIPLLAPLGQRFGVTPTVAAWAGSAFSFAFAAGNLFFGPLSDRRGRLQVIVPGLWALTGLTLLVSLSPSFAVLAALRALQGFVAASFASAALTYLVETLPPQRRASGIAAVSSSFLIAGVLGQVYASAVSSALGWAAVFGLLVPAYVVLALLLRRLPLTLPPASGQSWAEVLARMGRLMRSWPLLLTLLVGLTLLLSFVAMYIGLSAHLAQAYGLSARELLWVRLAGLPGLLLSPFTGALINRWGARAVITAGLVTAILGLLGEALLPSLAGVVIGSAVFVAGIGVTVPGVLARVSVLGSEARGAANAVYGAAVFLGASLGPVLAGVLAPHGFTALTLTLAAILAAAALLAQLRPEARTALRVS